MQILLKSFRESEQMKYSSSNAYEIVMHSCCRLFNPVILSKQRRFNKYWEQKGFTTWCKKRAGPPGELALFTEITYK